MTTFSELTHDVCCTECETLFACAGGHEPEVHEKRAARGWSDPCPSCRQQAHDEMVEYMRAHPLPDWAKGQIGSKDGIRACPNCGYVTTSDTNLCDCP
jgi:hypothetical protein